jgi:hypothetical protein
MGINAKDLQLWVRLIEQGYVKRGNRIIEIGAQQLANSFLRSSDLIRKAESLIDSNTPFAIPEPGKTVLGPGNAELQEAEAPYAREFFVASGLDYAAIDVDGSPQSISLDLNFDSIPNEMRGRYDIVTNFGTTEHICNQLNAFKAMHELASPGAVMIHHLPAGGVPNHGLINYNPKFFWYLARSNDYKWLYMDFHGGGGPYELPTNIIEYIQKYEPEAVRNMKGRKTVDYAVHVALQKTLDIPFVDVDTATTTDNQALRTRYWTVFQPENLEVARRESKMPPNISQNHNSRLDNSPNMTSSGDISDEIRTALNRRISEASDEIRSSTTKLISDSEESIRRTVNQKVSTSEEAIRTALGRIPGRRYLIAISAASVLATTLAIGLIEILIQLVVHLARF